MNVGLISNNYYTQSNMHNSFKGHDEKNLKEVDEKVPEEDLFEPDYCTQKVTAFWPHIGRIEEFDSSDLVKLKSGYINSY